MDSTEVRRAWADRSGAYSPEYYAHHGPNDTSERIRRVLDDAVDPDARVLELGCSAGRHLAHLHANGYTDLHGIDINDDAIDVLTDAYPALAADATIHARAIEDAVTEFPDDHFDATYSVETLQHVHPDSDWVFDELARITDTVLVTAENESGTDTDVIDDEFPLYYRNWRDVFTTRDLTQAHTESANRTTIRAFTPPDA